MAIFLLFLILVVLIYMAGILPGVLKFLGLVVGAMAVTFSGQRYGWPIVIGVSVAACAVALLPIWLTLRSTYHTPIKVPKGARQSLDDQLDRINKEQSARRSESENKKEEAMRKQREQTDKVDK